MTIRVFFSEFYPDKEQTGVSGSAASNVSRKSVEDIVKNLDDISLQRLENAREQYEELITEAEERFNELITLIDPASGSIGRRILDIEIKADDAIGRAQTIENVVGTPDGAGTLFGRIADIELITSGDTFVRSERFNTLEARVDVKARTFIQPNPPTGSPDGIELADGDLWIDSDDNNKLYRRNGNTWEDVTPAGSTLKTFVQDTAPSEDINTGDLWFDTSSNNKMHRYNGTAWIAVSDDRVGVLQSTVLSHTQSITDLETGKASNTALNQLESKTNLKNRVFYRATAPVSPDAGLPIIAGDVWFNTSDNNKQSVWNNGWTLVSDLRAIQELEAARNGFQNLNSRIGNLQTTLTDAIGGRALATDFNTLSAELTTARGGLASLNERLNSVDVNVNGSAAATRVGNLEVRLNGDPNAPVDSPERKGIAARITTTEQVAIDALGKANTTYGVVLDVNDSAVGFQIANNGTSNSFKIRSDKFEIAGSNPTGARTEYSGNSWKVYGPNGVLRVEMGVF